MKGNPSVITHLNFVLCQQLTAINQYFLHARMLKNWGVEQLGKAIYKESIQQMKYADDTIERILILEGLPNLQKLDKLFIGQAVAEIVDCDLKSEMKCDELLKDAIRSCEAEEDFVSRDILEGFKSHNEEWIDFLETQQGLIESVGLENYIQSQLTDD